MNEFLGSIKVADGYNGKMATLYLVAKDGEIYAVWRGGYFAATDYHLSKLTD